jgi:hypothetical protein
VYLQHSKLHASNAKVVQGEMIYYTRCSSGGHCARRGGTRSLSTMEQTNEPNGMRKFWNSNSTAKKTLTILAAPAGYYIVL